MAEGFLREPVSAVTSAAYVLAAIAVVVLARRDRRAGAPAEGLVGYALLVAGIGVGSFVQHGPDPAAADLLHDLPLAATLALLAADGVAAVRGTRRVGWWWVAPTAALAPLIVLVPRPADVLQAVMAGVAVVVTLLRARRRPQERPRIAVALGLLAVGGLIGALSRAGGPLCDPDSLWQGHAVWHVLSAAALVVLAPLVARRPARRGAAGSDDAPGS
ncbi:MAG: hypothetical protein H5T83_07485 [Actinotalea sp.]|nr:hypothetical protein [Actinotalea sp.]